MSMKSLLWQCVVITTLCCLVVQITAIPYESSSKYFPDKYFSPKRTKPSLSIVNPLDVLRQRVMLEMARRQRENAVRQEETNRQILRNIGKRGNLDYNDVEEYLKNRYYDTMRHHPNQAGSGSVESNSINKAETHQQQLNNVQGLSQPKTSEKVENKSKFNDPLQEQIYIFDDGDDDDGSKEAMQIKNLYRLLSRYQQNDM